ncbi:hypothetical protein HBI95_077750 [Parastagonospora nodorum]|nr:hypothetical protein HBH49_123230 [Parastagonospora nodorum]KAH4088579.1 hypothetical protein HBH46_195550 [Parastagonospora nodorum]KAH4209592.1 hypothetical protein HBI95_077750 [Parastagonospora nodorum]
MDYVGPELKNGICVFTNEDTMAKISYKVDEKVSKRRAEIVAATRAKGKEKVQDHKETTEEDHDQDTPQYDSDGDMIVSMVSLTQDEDDMPGRPRPLNLVQLATPAKLRHTPAAKREEERMAKSLELTVTLNTRLGKEDVKLPLLDMDKSEEMIKFAIHYVRTIEDEADIKMSFRDYIRAVQDPKLSNVPSYTVRTGSDANENTSTPAKVSEYLQQRYHDTECIVQMLEAEDESFFDDLYDDTDVRHIDDNMDGEHSGPSSTPPTLQVLSASTGDSDLSCNICHEAKTLPPVPTGLKHVDKSPDANEWWAAFWEEWTSLLENNTWAEIPRLEVPAGRKILSSKVVFKNKLGPEGSVIRRKARFVARGFEQRDGIDYFETFAPVVKSVSYKVLFALAAQFGWVCCQMDVKTAFLYGELEEEVYLEPPAGILKDDSVLRLRKSLYGLKQSPRQWYKKLKGVLNTMGWFSSRHDESVFIHNESGMYLTVYVDDLNIYAPTEEMARPVKEALKRHFKMTDLGECAFYLGMHVVRQPDGSIHLHQESFVQQILERFGMSQEKAVAIPLPSDLKLVKSTSATTTSFRQTYQAIVGSLNYLAVITRPDISLAVSLVSRHCANPDDQHMEAARRIMKYLKSSSELGLVYWKSPKLDISIYVDSDWAGCIDTRRSTTGWVVLFNGTAVSWSAKRQKTVALSSCEAEYVAAAEAAKEAIWMKNFVNELNIPSVKITTIPVFIDNMSAMKLAKNPEFHARTKHIDIRHHFLREQVLSGNIRLIRVRTQENPADLFTKVLARPRFVELRERLGMSGVELEETLK